MHGEMHMQVRVCLGTIIKSMLIDGSFLIVNLPLHLFKYHYLTYFCASSPENSVKIKSQIKAHSQCCQNSGR